jgi:hypothetical protein
MDEPRPSTDPDGATARAGDGTGDGGARNLPTVTEVEVRRIPRADDDAAEPARPKQTTKLRYALALCVALFADTIGSPFGEGFAVAFDLGIALAIVFLLGFRIELLFALLLEAVPGLGLFPSWLVAVPMIWVRTGGASTGFGASPPTIPPRGAQPTAQGEAGERPR